MQLCLLHLDDALARQADFMSVCESRGALHLDLRAEAEHIRLWGKERRLEAVFAALRRSFFSGTDVQPKLCFMGSGDFHHVSALLIDATLERQEDKVTVIHFDNHPDWVQFKNGMHCGSWVNRVAGNPKVEKIITVGPCSKDIENRNAALLDSGKLELFPFAQLDAIENILDRIKTKKIYITVDKDVLSREDCESNWDQGRMRLPYLLSFIRALGARHDIIGADVTGDYSRPRYAGNILTRLMKYAEIFIDQPRPLSTARAAMLNAPANAALLHAFAEVMA